METSTHKILLFSLLILSFATFATSVRADAERTPSQDLLHARMIEQETLPPVKLQSLQPGADMRDMPEGLEGHSLSEVRMPRGTLPDRTTRDLRIRQAGLESNISSMDELDRDLLAMHAIQDPEAGLLKRYEHLPREKIIKLSRLSRRGQNR